MTSKNILASLKKNDISSLLEDIQLLFESTDGKVDCAEVCNIVKAAYQLMALHEESNRPASYNLILRLIPSINLCVDYVKNNFLQEDLAKYQFLSVLYLIIGIYLKFELYCPAISQADTLELFLSSAQNSLCAKETYIKNLSALFWNEAFKIEKKSVMDFTVGFKLRCKAVDFVILDNPFIVCEKVLHTLVRYCKSNEEKDYKQIITFLQNVWNKLVHKRNNYEHSLYLFKLLYAWYNYFMKQFKHLPILKCFLPWLSELAMNLEKQHLQHSMFKSCIDISSSFIQVFLLKEVKSISKSLAYYKKIVNNYNSYEDFEVELLVIAGNFFYLSFVGTFKAFDSSQEEKTLLLMESNFDFCVLFVQLYLKMSSDHRTQKYFDFSTSLNMIILHTIVNSFSSLIKNEERAKKSQARIKKMQNLIKYVSNMPKPDNLTKELQKQFKSLAISIGNIGTILYNVDLFLESSCFLEISCNLFTLCSSMEGTADLQRLIWKKKEVLVYCDLFSGNHQKALHNVVKLMLEFNDKKKECMKLWQIVKRDALKVNDKRITSRTISDILCELNASISPEQEVDLLCAELKTCKFERSYLMDEITAVTNKIFSLPCYGINRAHTILEILNISPSVTEQITYFQNKSLLEMCLESTTLYQKYVAKHSDDIEAKLQLSVNYFWLYHLKMQQLHKVAEKEVECLMSSPEERNSENENNDICDIKPTFPLLNCLVEAEINKSLELALEIWLGISESTDFSWKDVTNIIEDWDILMILQGTAEAFSISLQDINEFKTWILLRNIAVSVGNKHYELQASISLTKFLIQMGYLNVASQLLMQIETGSLSDCNSTLDLEILKLNLQLVKSNYCLCTGKFDEGLNLLQNVLEDPLLERNFKSIKMLQIESLLLQSKYLIVPPSAFRDTKNIEYFQTNSAIASSMECVSIAHGLLKLVSEKQNSDKRNDWMAFKIALLRNVLKAYLVLAEQYLEIGDPRYARCYLKEGLKIAEAYISTHWASKILLVLGQIDLLCDNVNDCLVKLNGLKYIMDESSPQNASMQLLKIFNETESAESIDTSEDFIIPNPSKLYLKRDLKQNFINNSDVMASPIVNNRKKPFEFEVSFKASCAHRFANSLIRLEIWSLGCLYLIANDKILLAEKQLKKLINCYEALKKANTVSDLCAVKLGIEKESFCRTPSTYEVHLLASSLLELSLLYFSKNDLKNAEYYINCACKLLTESTDCEKYLYPNIYASLKYHKIVISLKNLLSINSNSSLEFFIYPSLKQTMSFSTRASKLTNSSVSDFKTPVKDKKFPQIIVTSHKDTGSICHAPLKKDVLPPYMKKDIESTSSRNQLSLIFSSSDDDVFSNTPKDIATKVKVLSNKKNSESKQMKQNSRRAPYKLFKSKNSSLDIKSASDIWNVPALTTPKIKKKLVKLQSSPKTKRKYRNTRTVNSSAVSPKSKVVKRAKKNSTLCNSKTEFFPDKTSEGYHSNEGIIDSVAQRKVSIECTRSTAKSKVKIYVHDTAPCRRKLYSDSPEVFFSSENSNSPELIYETNLSSVFDEICEDINRINIAEKVDKKNSTPIPAENLKDFIKELDSIRSLVQHYAPFPVYTDICSLLSALMMTEPSDASNNESKLLKFGFLLSETFSSTLRQIYYNKLVYSNKKLNNEALKTIIPQFMKMNVPINTQMEHLLSAIPKDYTVVQISAIPEKDYKLTHVKAFVAPKLLVCRYQQNSKPLAICIDSTSAERFNSSIFSEFDTLIMESTSTMKLQDDSRKWWTTRTTLDSRLKKLVKNMEDIWLGCWKGLLLSKPTNNKRKKQLMKFADAISELGTPSDRHLLEIFLDSIPSLSREHISAGICQLWNCNLHDATYCKVHKFIKDSVLVLPETKRHALIFVLDKNLQCLPWENLPILEDVPVSRMPSLSLMSAKLLMFEKNSPFHTGLDCSNTFYILNPGGDLKSSQERFQAQFEKQISWKGIIGRSPTTSEWASAFKDYDLFIYCGHGSSIQYSEGIAVEKLKCHAATILMGCSSGRLKLLGRRVEAQGFSLTFLMNGCPSVVGNLWDVTDKDIDRFTAKLCEHFIPCYSEAHNTSIDIASAVSQARRACKMRYLVGAAPVIYGFPVSDKSSSQFF